MTASRGPKLAAPWLGLLQLQRRAREATTPEALAFVMVNETLQLVPYRQAALWSTAGARLGPDRVAAVSGLPQPEPTAPYVQWLAALCRHQATTQGEAAPVSIAALPGKIAAAWSEWLPAHGLWLPLGREGGLLLVRDEAWEPHEIALLRELAHAYAHAWAAFSPRPSALRRALGAWHAGKARRRVLIGAALLLLLPVRITVLGQGEVSPKDAFVVRAPQDGVLDRFHVQPNQPVHQGDALFSLDTTTLGTRMELARAAVDTAQEEYRQSAQRAVSSDKNRAEVALRLGRLQEKSLEMQYTAQQLERVQAKADRDGIAVFADTQ